MHKKERQRERERKRERKERERETESQRDLRERDRAREIAMLPSGLRQLIILAIIAEIMAVSFVDSLSIAMDWGERERERERETDKEENESLFLVVTTMFYYV
jgi:hypothetical protein